MLASASGQKTYEWDAMRAGVFSALVRSGMRGLADTNLDGAVTYAEMAAFTTSAVETIADPRARPTAVSQPPAVDPQAPLAARSWFGQVDGAAINHEGWGRFRVEDAAGIVVAAAHLEPGFHPELWMNSAEGMIVVTQHGRLVRVATPAGPAFAPAPVELPTARGSVADELRQGLLSSVFGPAYFRGFSAAWTRSYANPTGRNAAPANDEADGVRLNRGAWALVPAFALFAAGGVVAAAVGTALLVEGLWSGTHAGSERAAWLGLARGAAGGSLTLAGLAGAAAWVAMAAAAAAVALL